VTNITIGNDTKESLSLMGSCITANITHLSNKSIINTNVNNNPLLTPDVDGPSNAINISNKNDIKESLPLIGSCITTNVNHLFDGSIINTNVHNNPPLIPDIDDISNKNDIKESLPLIGSCITTNITPSYDKYKCDMT